MSTVSAMLAGGALCLASVGLALYVSYKLQGGSSSGSSNKSSNHRSGKGRGRGSVHRDFQSRCTALQLHLSSLP